MAAHLAAAAATRCDARHMRSHTRYLTFRPPSAASSCASPRTCRRAVDESGVAGGHGARRRRCTSPRASGSTTTSRASTRTRSSGSTSSRRRAGSAPANDVARELLPDRGDYRHHRGGEDNGDAHCKNLLVHHQVVLPITAGRLDLGPWQAVFYAEFDGRRPKRLVIKVLGRVETRAPADQSSRTRGSSNHGDGRSHARTRCGRANCPRQRHAERSRAARRPSCASRGHRATERSDGRTGPRSSSRRRTRRASRWRSRTS